MRRVQTLVVAVIAALALMTGLGSQKVLALPQGDVDPWQILDHRLPDTLTSSASATYNGYVYVAGGADSGGYTDKVHYAKLNSNGTTDEWQTSANELPGVRTEPAVAAYNGYLYVMGGFDGGSTKNTVYYAPLNGDGSVGAWATSGNTLPYSANAATSVVNNGYIYYMGGVNFGSSYGTVAYASLSGDGSVGAWTTSPNSMDTRVRSGSFVANGRVYVIAGSDGSDHLDSIIYATLNENGSVSTWESANPSALPQALASVAVTYNAGYAYVIGGNSDDGPVSTVYYAKVKTNGTLGAWQTATFTPPVARRGAVAASYGEHIYLIGGSDSDSGKDEVYSAQVAPYNPNLDTDSDGALDAAEDAGPNDGDANSDDILDSQQQNVATFVNPLTSKYVALVLSGGESTCWIESIDPISESDNSTQDPGFEYSLGMLNFMADCPEAGTGNSVNLLYFDEEYNENFVIRKYDPGTHLYASIIDEEGPNIWSYTDGGDNTILAAYYYIEDGGVLDTDGVADGTITDPVGIGLAGDQNDNSDSGGGPGSGSSSNGLASTGQNTNLILVIGAGLLLAGAGVLAVRRLVHVKSVRKGVVDNDQ